VPTTRELDEQRLESLAPGYLATVRQATARIARRDPGADRARDALALLGDVVEIDTDVPTRSARPLVGLVKQAVKRLVGWYLRYLGDQVTVLGRSTHALGAALVDDGERRDAELGDLRRRVAELADRVDQLESGR
jgi:hypothetical protein